jgi:hypothetical protein
MAGDEEELSRLLRLSGTTAVYRKGAFAALSLLNDDDRGVQDLALRSPAIPLPLKLAHACVSKTYGAATKNVANTLKADTRWKGPQEGNGVWKWALAAASTVGFDGSLMREVLAAWSEKGPMSAGLEVATEIDKFYMSRPAFEDLIYQSRADRTYFVNPFSGVRKPEVLEALLEEPRLDPTLLAIQLARKCIEGLRGREGNDRRGMLMVLLSDPRIVLPSKLLESSILMFWMRNNIGPETLRHVVDRVDMKSDGFRRILRSAVDLPFITLVAERDLEAGLFWFESTSAGARTKIEVYRVLETAHGAVSSGAIGPAAASGDLAFVQFLLTRADPPDTASCERALFLAAEKGHTETVEFLLLLKDVDPSADDNAAVDAAVQAGHTETVVALMKDPRVNPRADPRAASSGAPPPPYSETA